jgi:arylsulfatase A-like enzyme
MHHHRSLLLFLLAFAPVKASSQPDSRPNILLIVADDLGYADLGCYGGDIRTPVIDKIAAEGQLFTQFHTAPSCAPTRAMLLSGNNNHVAGMGRQGGAAGPWEASQPGYEGYLTDRVIPFPQLLLDAGYHTYTAGKWHLGRKPEHSPMAKGFERSFSLLQGASNHYNNMGLTLRDSVSSYSADGKLTEYPSGRYATEFYTDKLMEFIRGGKDGKPFFAFAAYTSPHWPLQAPAVNDRYKGKYDIGYDSLRVLRFESLKRAGILPKNQKLPPQLESIKAWATLTAEEKRIESRKMELYAAMVDNLDEQVGRLIEFLKKEGLYENTLIVFMSDNGAGNEDFYTQKPYADFIAPRYDNRYENMGAPTSFVSYGPPWAKAGAAPFSYYKGYGTEGGTVAPLIVSGRSVISKRGLRRDFVTVMDLAPTFLELAGVKYPGELGTSSTRPMLGESMISSLRGKSDAVHDSTYAAGLWAGGSASFRRGRWKLVNTERPYREDRLKLYDVVGDPGETTDLSAARPATYRAMLDAWRQYVKAHDIRLQPSTN